MDVYVRTLALRMLVTSGDPRASVGCWQMPPSSVRLFVADAPGRLPFHGKCKGRRSGGWGGRCVCQHGLGGTVRHGREVRPPDCPSTRSSVGFLLRRWTDCICQGKLLRPPWTLCPRTSADVAFGRAQRTADVHIDNPDFLTCIIRMDALS